MLNRLRGGRETRHETPHCTLMNGAVLLLMSIQCRASEQSERVRAKLQQSQGVSEQVSERELET